MQYQKKKDDIYPHLYIMEVSGFLLGRPLPNSKTQQAHKKYEKNYTRL